LQFPSSFGESDRNVRLTGEAFFDVVKNKRQPFLVDLGKIGIKVLGTRFDVINYDDESQTEVVLESGKVNLFEQKGKKMRVITEIGPGQKAIYKKAENNLAIQNVDTEKYISWINGRLIFRDDPMDEVIRKLDRWFNVDIELADPEISQYVYTATFQHETINQILELFKRTSPVEYQIKEAALKQDGSFSKQKIILKKRIN
jgi:ferric-dicitrate binding protein FerR (iron transport regulator)